MNLTVNRKQLLTSLDMAMSAIDKKCKIPILQNVLMVANEGYLTLTATDLENSIETSITAEVAETGTTTLPAATVQKFIKAMKAESVTLESDGITMYPCPRCKGTGCETVYGITVAPKCTTCEGKKEFGTPKMKLTSGLASITIDGLDAWSFPELPKVGKVDILDIDSSAWLDMIAKVRYAISKEESRFTLNGFLLDQNGATRMVATDGHRLSLVQRGETCDSPHVKALIRLRCADLVKKVFGKSNRMLSITKDDRHAFIRSGDTLIVTALLTGSFPDYERVIPNYQGQHAKLTAADLLAGIDAVYHAADERSHSIKVEFNCSSVKLSASTVGGSSASIEIPCETGMCHGVTVGLNAEYVKEFASTLPKSDDIYISCAGTNNAVDRFESGKTDLADMDKSEAKRIKLAASSPWGFTAGSDFNYRHVIMPMRLS